METKNRSKNIIGMKEQSIERAKMEENASKESKDNSGHTEPSFELSEERWPEFKNKMQKRFPDLQDADLPYRQRIDDTYFGSIEKKHGHSVRKLREAASPFYTWKV